MNSAMLLFVLSAILSALSQAFLKKAALSAKGRNAGFVRALLDWRVLAGYALLLATTVLNTLAYRTNSMSTGAFITTLSYVFVGAVGVVVFKEKLTRRMLLAYALIIAGVLIIIA